MNCSQNPLRAGKTGSGRNQGTSDIRHSQKSHRHSCVWAAAPSGSAAPSSGCPERSCRPSGSPLVLPCFWVLLKSQSSELGNSQPHPSSRGHTEGTFLLLRFPWVFGFGFWEAKMTNVRGTWVAQLVELPTSAQVTISTFCEFEPRVGLCVDSSEPGACFGFCVSLSLCPFPAYAVSLSVSKINKH